MLSEISFSNMRHLTLVINICNLEYFILFYIQMLCMQLHHYSRSQILNSNYFFKSF